MSDMTKKTGEAASQGSNSFLGQVADSVRNATSISVREGRNLININMVDHPTAFAKEVIEGVETFAKGWKGNPFEKAMSAISKIEKGLAVEGSLARKTETASARELKDLRYRAEGEMREAKGRIKEIDQEVSSANRYAAFHKETGNLELSQRYQSQSDRLSAEKAAQAVRHDRALAVAKNTSERLVNQRYREDVSKGMRGSKEFREAVAHHEKNYGINGTAKPMTVKVDRIPEQAKGKDSGNTSTPSSPGGSHPGSNPANAEKSAQDQTQGQKPAGTSGNTQSQSGPGTWGPNGFTPGQGQSQEAQQGHTQTKEQGKNPNSVVEEASKKLDAAKEKSQQAADKIAAVADKMNKPGFGQDKKEETKLTRDLRTSVSEFERAKKDEAMAEKELNAAREGKLANDAKKVEAKEKKAEKAISSGKGAPSSSAEKKTASAEERVQQAKAEQSKMGEASQKETQARNDATQASREVGKAIRDKEFRSASPQEKADYAKWAAEAAQTRNRADSKAQDTGKQLHKAKSKEVTSKELAADIKASSVRSKDLPKSEKSFDAPSQGRQQGKSVEFSMDNGMGGNGHNRSASGGGSGNKQSEYQDPLMGALDHMAKNSGVELSKSGGKPKTQGFKSSISRIEVVNHGNSNEKNEQPRFKDLTEGKEVYRGNTDRAASSNQGKQKEGRSPLGPKPEPRTFTPQKSDQVKPAEQKAAQGVAKERSSEARQKQPAAEAKQPVQGEKRAEQPQKAAPAREHEPAKPVEQKNAQGQDRSHAAGQKQGAPERQQQSGAGKGQAPAEKTAPASNSDVKSSQKHEPQPQKSFSPQKGDAVKPSAGNSRGQGQGKGDSSVKVANSVSRATGSGSLGVAAGGMARVASDVKTAVADKAAKTTDAVKSTAASITNAVEGKGNQSSQKWGGKAENHNGGREAGKPGGSSSDRLTSLRENLQKVKESGKSQSNNNSNDNSKGNGKSNGGGNGRSK